VMRITDKLLNEYNEKYYDHIICIRYLNVFYIKYFPGKIHDHITHIIRIIKTNFDKMYSELWLMKIELRYLNCYRL